MNLTILLADATAGDGGQAAGGGGCMGGQGATSLIMMLLMFAVFYFVLIRPQQKKAKEHQNMLSNLKKGDTVVTRGGVIGRVSGIADNVLVLELQEKVRVRVAKGYIDGLFKDDAAKASEPKKKDKEDKDQSASSEAQS
ncbi:MAG TPA: preprotein translocase subunit YajC [Haliangiales bacterium]|nr:preprotein translocase subunit YajC [Haliangiales bacterium]